MDANRIIKIEELEVGDKILVASNGSLRYYKVLRKPKMTSKLTKYSKGVPVNKWSGTRCSIYFCTGEDHNYERMIYGLNYKDMWLIKRDI